VPPREWLDGINLTVHFNLVVTSFVLIVLIAVVRRGRRFRIREVGIRLRAVLIFDDSRIPVRGLVES